MREVSLIDEIVWTTPPERLHLSAGALHVWIADLDLSDVSRGSWREFLSIDESARAARFRFEKDQLRYIAGRGILRSILGRYLNVPPASLRFDCNAYGKPCLASGSEGERLRFNLAHSHGLALYAITPGHEVGIDLERMRDDFDTQELAERFFSREEVKILTALPLVEQKAAFFECWTRKEAFIKARGMALSLPLDQFVVAFGAGTAPAVLSANDDSQAATRWLMRDLRPARGYVGAVVVESREVEFQFWRFDPKRSP